MGTLFRYLVVAGIGAVVGATAFARATNALPLMGSRFMTEMMSRMEGTECGETCREMMAGHRHRHDTEVTVGREATAPPS